MRSSFSRVGDRGMRALSRGQRSAWRGLAVGTILLLGGLKLPAATTGWGDGVNLQPSYFNEGRVDLGWSLLRQQEKIRTVRIEIEPFVPLATAQRWLAEAQAEGYRIIATYHNAKANGSDRVEDLIAAAKWWRANYATLRQAASFTVNLMNEWGSHRQRPESFARAYNEALSILREVYDGPVIVDIPGWAQETYVAREASKLIRDENLIFSVHVYSSGWVEFGPRRWMQPEDLDALEASGRPVIVGEFGGLREGGADWSALVDHARAKGWPLLAWAWNGDGEGMNMAQPYWGDVPGAKHFTKSSYFALAYAKLREPTRAAP